MHITKDARIDTWKLILCLLAFFLVLPTVLPLEMKFRVIGSSGTITYSQGKALLKVFVIETGNTPEGSIPFKVDGSSIHPNGTEYWDGDMSYSLAAGNHTIEMPSPWTSPYTGTTYFFSFWGDGSTDNPRTTTFEADETYSFQASYAETEPTPPPPPPTPSEPPPNGVWRPFTDNSIWNTKIPDDVAIHPESDTMISRLPATGFGITGGPYGMWSQPIWDAYPISRGTPKFYVTGENSEWVNPVPIPSGCKPDASADGRCVIIDWDNEIVYETWQGPYWTGSTYRASAWFKWKLYGSGVATSRWACQAASTSNLAGTIRPHEIEAGVIPHALSGSVKPQNHRLGAVVYPVARTTCKIGTWDTNAIPYGARLQLNPDYDISWLSRDGQIVAQALKDYGWFLRDCGGSNMVANAESKETADWASVGGFDTGCLFGIPLHEFRVLAYGQKDAYGNVVTGNLYNYPPAPYDSAYDDWALSSVQLSQETITMSLRFEVPQNTELKNLDISEENFSITAIAPLIVSKKETKNERNSDYIYYI